MFGVTKERLTTVLGQLQLMHCSYWGGTGGKPPICDCKYVKEGEKVRPGSESGPGCCELALAQKIIENMTLSEYIRVCRRAGITVFAYPETDRPMRRKKVPVNPLARVDKTSSEW